MKTHSKDLENQEKVTECHGKMKKIRKNKIRKKKMRVTNQCKRKLLRKLCYALGIVGVLVSYLVVGALFPFVKQKEVNASFQAEFQIDDFYSDSIGVDRAAIIEDSDEALEVRLHMIEQAKESILFSTFSIKTDRASEEVCAALYAAANRGVKVKMLIDGLSGEFDMKRAPMYYALGAHDNVEIRYYNSLNLLKPWTVNGRLHDKYLVVDDQLLLLGGRNTSNYFVGTYNENVLSYDREVFVYNTEYGREDNTSVIYQVIDYFQSIYFAEVVHTEYENAPLFKKEAIKEAAVMLQDTYDSMRRDRPELFLTDADYYDYTIATNRITLVYNPTHILSKEPYVWYTLCQLMENAKECVYIQTPYAVLNDVMYENLASVGKDIDQFSILLNSIAVGDNICASADYILNKDKINDTGVTVYEFHGDHSMHNKSVLIDHNISIIGSFNFDMRSSYINTETMLVIHGEEFNKELSENIQAMEEKSYELNSEGHYIFKEDVEMKEISPKKDTILAVLPYVLYPFRFLL